MTTSFNIYAELIDLSLDFIEKSNELILDSETNKIIFDNGTNEQETVKLKTLANAFSKARKRLGESLKEAEQDAAIAEILPPELAASNLKNSNTALNTIEFDFCTHSVRFAEHFALCALKSFDTKDVASWLPDNAKHGIIAEVFEQMKAPNLAKLCEHKIALD